MTTLTIDIPDDNVEEVLTQLKKFGIKVQGVNLTKEDYQERFEKSRKASSLDETSYLLKSPNNAARLLKSIEDYENGLGQERTLVV
jgi:hypothetical protein